MTTKIFGLFLRLFYGLILGIFLVSAVRPATASKLESVQSPTANPVVVIVHFAPFASEDPQKRVSVSVNDTEVVESLPFGGGAQGTIATQLPPGEHLVEIRPVGMDTVVISGTVTLAEDTIYTLAAIGDGINHPLELYPLVNDVVPAADAAKIRLTHLAPFAPSGTTVEICVVGESTPLATLAYKDTTMPYLQLPPGFVDLLVAVAGSNCSVVLYAVPYTVALSSGEIIDAFIVGGANDVPVSAAATTEITIAQKLYLPLLGSGSTLD